MAGKPRRLYLDNASEFKSEALRRGCEQHGIELSYRPLGRPHYGGIIERIVGTVMQRVCKSKNNVVAEYALRAPQLHHADRDRRVDHRDHH